MKRIKRASERVSVDWFLWRSGRRGWMELENGERVPGADGYPGPWAPTHLREYLCTLVAADHRWGPETTRRSMFPGATEKRCRICRTTAIVSWGDRTEAA